MRLGGALSPPAPHGQAGLQHSRGDMMRRFEYTCWQAGDHICVECAGKRTHGGITHAHKTSLVAHLPILDEKKS